MKEKLYRTHVAIFIFMLQLGVVVITLPRIMAQTFGYNGWLMLPVFMLIAAFNIGLISAVYKLAQGKSVFEILERALTKAGAYPLYVVFVMVWSLLGCMAAKQYVFIFQSMAFPTTHPMVFKLLIDAIAYSLLIKGIYNISKATTSFFWIIVWMFFLLLFFVPDFEFARMTPFLLKGGSDVVRGSFDGYTAFLGYEMSLFLIPYVDPRPGFIRAVHVGNIMTGFVYTLFSFISFGFYSYGQLIAIRYPMLDMFSYVRLPFVERIETLFFGFFFFTNLITIVVYAWASLEALKRMAPGVRPKLLALGLLAFIYAISWFPDTLSKVQAWLKWLGYIQFSIAFGLPIALIAIMLLGRIRRGQREE